MAEALYNFIIEDDDLVVKFSCSNHTRRINEVVRNLLDKDNSKRESDPKVTCHFKAKSENVSFSVKAAAVASSTGSVFSKILAESIY